MHKTVPFSLLSAVFIIAASCGNAPQLPEEASTPETVVAIPAEKESVPIYGEYVGQTLPSLYVKIQARVSGFLEERFFDEGSIVQKGEKLYHVDARPYQARVDRVEAQLKSDQAALTKAERDRIRIEPLYEQNAASQLDMDEAISAAEQAAAKVVATEAELEEARLELSYTDVNAPITGLVGESRADIGALVGPQGESLLTTISQVDPIFVRFSLTGAEYLQFRKEASGARDRTKGVFSRDQAVVIILPDESEYGLQGKLNFADPRVDPTTGTFAVRAEFGNPKRLLLPGQFVRVKLLKDTRFDVITIPQRAVQTSQGGAFIWVAMPNSKLERRFILTSDRFQNKLIVERGLGAGEMVVVEGIQKARQGLEVEILSSIEEYEKQLSEQEAAEAESSE